MASQPSARMEKVLSPKEMAAKFKQKMVQQILQHFFKDDKIKISTEALALMTEVITVFVSEAVTRTGQQAEKDGEDEMSLDQFEKILPQLLLDL